MALPRVLTIQDISCVGRCSMAVALPVLAACGVEYMSGTISGVMVDEDEMIRDSLLRER